MLSLWKGSLGRRSGRCNVRGFGEDGSRIVAVLGPLSRLDVVLIELVGAESEVKSDLSF